MNLRKTIPVIAVIVSLGLFATMAFGNLDSYPDRLATHFNAAGTADGWMSKESFRSSSIITTLGICGMILGLFWVIRFLPDSLINLPNRNLWLSPQNRRHTFSLLLNCGLLIAASLMLFLTSLHHQVLRANLKSPPQLGSRVWLEALAILILTAAILGHAMWRWYHPGKPLQEG